MKKHIVNTYIHLEDAKGWGKIIEWKNRENPPNTYFIPKINRLTLRPLDFETLPPILDRYEFRMEETKYTLLRENYYDRHVYYKEV